MSYFLVIYDRRQRHAPDVERVDDPGEAQRRLFDLARELRDDRGVVLLVADREEDLVRTHGHHFRSMDELMQPTG
jgi:hypothetical protein